LKSQSSGWRASSPPIVSNLSRGSALAAIAESRRPELEPVISIAPSATVHEVSREIVRSPSGMIVLQNQPRGRLIAIVTLHDLLRAQLDFANNSGE
jgi:CBS domain-containing protein